MVFFWNESEDTLLLRLAELKENRWSIIVHELQKEGVHRSTDAIRNRVSRLKQSSHPLKKPQRCRVCGMRRRGHSCPTNSLRIECMQNSSIQDYSNEIWDIFDAVQMELFNLY